MGMTKARAIPPSLWRMKKWLKLPLETRMLSIALFCSADDLGRGVADPDMVKADGFVYDDLTPEWIADQFEALEAADFLRWYSDSEEFYYSIEPTLWPAQSHSKGSDYPTPPERPNHTASTSAASGSVLDRFSAREREGRERLRGRAGTGWEGLVAEESSQASRDRREEAAASIGLPPNPPDEFCPQHEWGTTGKCTACGDGRKRAAKYRRLVDEALETITLGL